MADRPGPPGTAPSPDRPAADSDPIDAAIDDAGAVGFVAVGTRFDPDLRHLTRFRGPENEYAFVRVSGRSVVCAPGESVGRVKAEFDGEVAADRVGDPAGERAAAVLDEYAAGDTASAGGTVLVPPRIPHDAAVYLERAGYDLRSTAAVTEARATKSESEIDAIRAVQVAAAAAVREGERLLATADSAPDGELSREGRQLTVERLRRGTNAELARHGVTDADNTVVRASTGRDRTTGVGAAPASDRPLRPDEPITVAVAPRGPHGYYGSLARTLVVDSNGGWERRAYVAVESALDAALAAVEAGAVARAVGREADAELAAFGCGSDPESAGGAPPAPGHGVGLSRRERPSLDAGAELQAGNVVAVEPQVVDSDRGTVRLSALVAVTADGYERLGDGDPSFTPRE
jgi:Xaa-Pro aminopeptidase